jgi:hypothetical protein
MNRRIKEYIVKLDGERSGRFRGILGSRSQALRLEQTADALVGDECGVYQQLRAIVEAGIYAQTVVLCQSLYGIHAAIHLYGDVEETLAV